VARSNIHGLTKLGAKVIVCGPPTLVPTGITTLGVEALTTRDTARMRCAQSLRVQLTQADRLFPICREYAHFSAWMRLAQARKRDVLCSSRPDQPRVEITPDVADGRLGDSGAGQYGLPVRMPCWLLRKKKNKNPQRKQGTALCPCFVLRA